MWNGFNLAAGGWNLFINRYFLLHYKCFCLSLHKMSLKLSNIKGWFKKANSLYIIDSGCDYQNQLVRCKIKEEGQVHREGKQNTMWKEVREWDSFFFGEDNYIKDNKKSFELRLFVVKLFILNNITMDDCWRIAWPPFNQNSNASDVI